MSSNELCKACTLLEGLERGMATSAIVRMIPVWQVRFAESLSQTDRARKRLDDEGPGPDNLRTIPYFQRGNTAPSSQVANG